MPVLNLSDCIQTYHNHLDEVLERMTSTLVTEHVASLCSNLGLQSLLKNPVLVSFGMAIGFALFEASMNYLVISRDHPPKGPQQYGVRIKDGTLRKDLDWLRENIADYDIIDIERLPGFIDSLAIGIDLCVGAIALDAANLLASTQVSTEGSTSAVTIFTVGFLVFHLVTLGLNVVWLKEISRSEPRIGKNIGILATALIGLIALATAFLTSQPILALLMES
jgi:hypothetical protein